MEIEKRIGQGTAELSCSFTRVVRNSRPALLASISVPILHRTAHEDAFEGISFEGTSQSVLPQTGETVDEPSGDRLSVLLDHAQNLNVRLPLLKVSVRVCTYGHTNGRTANSSRVDSSGIDGSRVNADASPTRAKEGPVGHCIFVLHGLFGKPITAQNLSYFLEQLTQDFATFRAYAKAHNIEIAPEQNFAKLCAQSANTR